MEIKKYIRSNAYNFRILVYIYLVITCFAIFGDYEINKWLFALFMYFVYGCLGITVTFHRYLCHKSFKMSRPMEIIFTMIGTLAGTGSSIAWVNMHFAHHMYSDTDKDPHSPHNGFFKMLFLKYRTEYITTKGTKRLLKDRYHLFLHKNYLLVHVAFAAILLLVGGVDAVLFAYIVPVVITALMSNINNYFSHTSGYRNHETKDMSRNHPILGYLSFGEGWHNNHHRYPGHAKIGEKWWEFDLSWQVIKLIKKA